MASAASYRLFVSIAVLWLHAEVRTIQARSSSSSTSSSAPRFFPTWTYDSPCKRMEWNVMPDVSVDVTTGSRLQIWNAHQQDATVFNLTFVGFPSNSTASSLPSDSAIPGLGAEDVQSLNATTEDDLVVLNGQCMAMKVQTGSNFTDISAARKLGKLIAGKLKGKRSSNGPLRARLWFSAMVPEVVDDEVSNTTSFPNATVLSTYVSELGVSLWNGLYSDQRYKGRPKDDEHKIGLDIVIESEEPDLQNSIRTAIETSKKIAKGVYMTRDIVQAPHNVLNSVSLADTATRLAYENRRLQCRISTPPQSMGAFWAVARGSETPPRLIHLVYRGPKRIKRRIAVVGKGLLFDTGGYSIKTSTGMETMKVDCGGAAACLGAAVILAALAPPHVEVHFVVAACENMINERAMVPGDVLQASNGKTIEVLNTDAEGRLTLADALVYVDEKLQCDEIVELSTLTGSCMAALGPSFAGIFTHNEELCQDLMASSKATGERLWRLPMAKEEYGEWIQSKIADLRNIGTGRFAGASTAALFLQEFVSTSKPFAHLDIAGTTFHDKQATGYGARLVADWIVRKSSTYSKDLQ